MNVSVSRFMSVIIILLVFSRIASSAFPSSADDLIAVPLSMTEVEIS